MGRNGSGKSTLLKILSSITLPDSGKAIINGSFSSILEIGTGFHPDLSGRDNIYLAGSMLGFHKNTLDAKFKKILEFSEIGDFIDTPVKYYSSGMFIRLAFSIVSELQSDIILLDEVMAVGDSSFSLKSFDKIKSLTEDGKTVIMVSHDPMLITQLCNRCMVLENGKVLAIGKSVEIVANYEEEAIEERLHRIIVQKAIEPKTNIEQNLSSHLKSIKILQDGIIKKEYLNSKLILIQFDIEKKDTRNIKIALAFNYQITIPVLSATPSRNISENQTESNSKPGLYTYTLSLPENYFNHGIYSIDLFLSDEDNCLIEKIGQAVFFKVVRIEENEDIKDDFNFLGSYSGPLVPVLDWKVEKRSLQEE
ncbi:MAG: ATP-binding cassette domain-containing protein [Chitinophagales bacterium]|nr:ATP-binding cassette domain-containing protein [Chitinophagales bacterium]